MTGVVLVSDADLDICLSFWYVGSSCSAKKEQLDAYVRFVRNWSSVAMVEMSN